MGARTWKRHTWKSVWILALVVLSACGGTPPSSLRLVEMPTVERVISAYDTRVHGLERLRSSASIAIRTWDADRSRWNEDHLNGYLELEAPHSCYLRLDKVGE